MGLLFIDQNKFRLMAIGLYAISLGVYSLQFAVPSSLSGRWFMLIAVVLSFQLLLFIANSRSAFSYKNAALSNFFRMESRDRGRAYFVQTILIIITILPVSILLNTVFFDWSVENVSAISLTTVWLVSLVGLADLTQIIYLNGAK